jgi:hypothetical protein
MHSKELSQIFTYQTRLLSDESSATILDDCAEIFSHIKHQLFADISRGKIATDLKADYLKKHKITARHFNALRVEIEGKISSIKERQAQRILELGYKIEETTKTIQKLEKKAASNWTFDKFLPFMAKCLQRVCEQGTEANIRSDIGEVPYSHTR